MVFPALDLLGGGGESLTLALAAIISCCFVGLKALLTGGTEDGGFLEDNEASLRACLRDEVLEAGVTISGVRLSNSSRFANIRANNPLCKN